MELTDYSEQIDSCWPTPLTKFRDSCLLTPVPPVQPPSLLQFVDVTPGVAKARPKSRISQKTEQRQSIDRLSVVQGGSNRTSRKKQPKPSQGRQVSKPRRDKESSGKYKKWEQRLELKEDIIRQLLLVIRQKEKENELLERKLTEVMSRQSLPLRRSRSKQNQEPQRKSELPRNGNHRPKQVLIR